MAPIVLRRTTVAVVCVVAGCGGSGDDLDRRLVDASRAGRTDEARRLVERGADVNAKDDREESAYLLATSEGDLELLELTLANGAEVDARDSYNGTALIRAAERGHADVIRRLRDADIDVDHVNHIGYTALLEAVVFGDGGPRYQATVRVLLALGADVAIADRDGATPLLHAAERGQPEVVDLLLAAGAKPNDADDDRAAPLLAAVVRGDGSARYARIVRSLLRAGADAAVADRDGVTARRHARARGQRAVAAALARAADSR